MRCTNSIKMKKLLTVLFLLISYCSFGQLWQVLPQYGYVKNRDSTKLVLRIPSDTTNNKIGTAQIGATLYAGNGTYWTAAGGGGGAAITASNGLTKTVNDVALGGALTQGTNITNATGYDFKITIDEDNADNGFVGKDYGSFIGMNVGSAHIYQNNGGNLSQLQVSGGSAILEASGNGVAGYSSSVVIRKDSITLNPYKGNLTIDSLNNGTAQNVLLGWEQGASQGGVGYITAGSGITISAGVITATAPLTATYIGYGNGSNVLTGTSPFTIATGTGILTTPKIVLNSTVDAGAATDAAIIINRTLNVANNGHGFKDYSSITNNSTSYAAFDAQHTIASTGASDHSVSFQARPIILKGAGLLNTNWAFLDQSEIHSPITTSTSFESLPVMVAGGTVGTRIGFRVREYAGTASLISNTYGVWFDALTKSTGDNYAMYDNGSNKSYLYNVRVGDKMYVGSNVTPTAKLHIAAGSATVNTAPIKLTTGPVTTAAVAGQIEYTTPQLFFTNGAAVRQELFQGQQSRVSTQYDNATTTLGNVTGLTANVAAGKVYRFEATLYTTSNAAGGVKVAIAGSATATAIVYEGLTTDAGLTTQSRGTALATAVGAVTAVTAAYVKVTGTITVNAAGTLLVQAAANVAVGTTSVLVGSTFVVTEIL